MKILEKEQIIDALIVELKEMKPKLDSVIEAESHFTFDLDLDSLDITEFIARSEQKYQIEIHDDHWRDLDNLNKLTEYIMIQLNE